MAGTERESQHHYELPTLRLPITQALQIGQYALAMPGFGRARRGNACTR